MKSGGQRPREVIAALARIAGAIFPITLTLYGLLLITGSIESSSMLNAVLFTLTASLWLAVTLLHYLVMATGRSSTLASSRSTKETESIQRERLLTLVNNMADAVLSTDAKGIVRIYNAASLSLIDTNDSLNGKHIDDIIQLKTTDGTPVSLFQKFKNAHGVIIDDGFVYEAGDEQLRLEVTYSPIRGSYEKPAHKQHDGFIAILRDVTKTKSLEEERDEFISVVSHELRTPITIAEGTISNVQLMFDREDIHSSKLKDSLNTAHEQVIFLAKLVNDLSTLSRAERGVADTPEDIDVDELVHDLYNEYHKEALAKGLQLDLDIHGKPGVVAASRLYLHELLQNFVTNALKYTKEGTITIKVTGSSDSVLFEVVDTGIGISKSDREKVFNKFYRSEDYRTRETGGTGLGLYVAAKLAHKLQTTINLKSRLNHGSNFSFSLPKKQKHR